MADYTLSAKITADDTAFQKKMSSVQGKLESVSKKFSSIGSTLTSLGTKMTVGLTLPIALLGKSMVQSASDFEENLNKVDVAFGNSANAVKEWSNTAIKQFGLSKNQALQATSLFGDMATSMGLTKPAAAEMSMSLAGLAGDLASFKNVSIDQAMTALNGVFTGETESLKQLGIVMTETNLEEFASKTGKVYSQMSQAEKVQLRYNYVMEMTKNAQGDYARTADGTANSLRTFQGSVDNLKIALGERLLPILTPLIQNATKLVDAFANASPVIQNTVLIIGGIMAVMGPLLVVFGTVIKSIGTIAGAFGALSAKIAAVGGLKAALAGVFTAITGPVAIAVAAITAIIGVITYLMKTNESFRASVMKVISSVISSVQSVLSALMPILSNIANTIGSVIGSTIQKLAPVISNIISMIGGFITSAAPIITNFLNTIAPKIQTIISAIAKVAMTVTSALMPIIQTIISIIGSTVIPIILKILTIATSVIGGIISVVTPIISFIATVITNIITVVSSVISAVSTIFNTVKSIITTVWNGIKTVIGGAINLIISVINKIISPVRTTFNNVKNIIVGVFNKIKSSWKGLTGVVSGVFNSISGAVSNVVGKIKGVINSVIGKVNTAIGVINDIGGIVGISISTIPYLKRGTDNWQGGFAYMNEAGRGELTYLPNGSQVIPHDLSVKYAKESARLNNNTSSFDVYALGEYIVNAVSNQGSQIANSLERGVGNIRMVTDNREVARMVSNLGFRRG